MRRIALIAVVALLVVGVAWWITKDKSAGPASHDLPTPTPTSVHSPAISEPLDPVVAKPDRTAVQPVAPKTPDTQPPVTRPADAAEVEVPFATLSGELVIPVAWNAGRPRLAARRKDSPKSFTQSRDVEIGPPVRSGLVDTFQWKIFNLTPATYEVLSLDHPCAIEAVLAPAGTANLRLEVPPPARVFVHVVDSVTNVNVPARFLVCTPKRADGSLYPMANHAERNKETETYHVRSPPGDAQLSAPFCGLDYPEGRMSVNVLPGDNHFTLRLEKFAVVRLTLFGGETQFQSSQDHFLVREVDGDGSPMVWDALTESGSVLAKVTNPGRYRVTLRAPITGYLMPDEQIVELASGTVKDVAIRLTKKP